MLDGWIKVADGLVNDTRTQAQYNAEDAGPDTELEYWRIRMA